MRQTCLPVETNYSRGMSDKKWDVFICHASEDKDFFVRPLAVSLNQLGAEVWYDEFSLRLGDCLSRSIDHGLANSHFGIVVISANFIGKAWPERELGGLVSREIGQGRVIIPIWHRVTRKQVLDFSPTLPVYKDFHRSWPREKSRHCRAARMTRVISRSVCRCSRAIRAARWWMNGATSSASCRPS